MSKFLTRIAAALLGLCLMGDSALTILCQQPLLSGRNTAVFNPEFSKQAIAAPVAAAEMSSPLDPEATEKTLRDAARELRTGASVSREQQVIDAALATLAPELGNNLIFKISVYEPIIIDLPLSTHERKLFFVILKNGQNWDKIPETSKARSILLRVLAKVADIQSRNTKAAERATKILEVIGQAGPAAWRSLAPNVRMKLGLAASGMESREIAEHLGVGHHYVMTTISRALKDLPNRAVASGHFAVPRKGHPYISGRVLILRVSSALFGSWKAMSELPIWSAEERRVIGVLREGYLKVSEIERSLVCSPSKVEYLLNSMADKLWPEWHKHALDAAA